VSTVEVIYERCAGLDVGKDEVVACIRVPDGAGGRRQEVCTYPTFSSGLESLAEWLQDHDVTQVVLEATGQYWKPIWYVLEERGLELLLVNAATSSSCPAARPTLATRPGCASYWSTGCCAAASCRRRPFASCGT
jgi:transposase